VFTRIDPRLPTPLWAQIAAAVRGAIASGELAAGDALPSVRALAAQLRVNPATVVQAYRDLEQAELIEMRQGAGSFVRDVPHDKRDDARLIEFRHTARAFVADVERLGIAPAVVRRTLDELLSGESA
jgi:GntR family transcriptional regulator